MPPKWEDGGIAGGVGRGGGREVGSLMAGDYTAAAVGLIEVLSAAGPARRAWLLGRGDAQHGFWQY